MKNFIKDKFDDILPGIALHVDTTPNARINSLLEYCDILCKNALRALDRKRARGEVHQATMYTDRTRTPPRKSPRKIFNPYGKGKSWKGKGLKGKGKRMKGVKGKGKGVDEGYVSFQGRGSLSWDMSRGKGKGYAFMTYVDKDGLESYYDVPSLTHTHSHLTTTYTTK